MGWNRIQRNLDPFVVEESTVRTGLITNRVDYHPRRSRASDLPDWDLGIGDWVAGKETFEEYDSRVSFPLGCVVRRLMLRLLGWESLMGDSVSLFV